MNYTIKKSELLKLAAAREIQTRETAENHFRETGQQLKNSLPEMSKEWARVRFVNGSTFELAVPVGKLAKWAGLLRADAMAIEFEHQQHAERIKLVCGGSEIAVNCTGENSDEPAKQWAGRLGSPIPCVAPEAGGEFVVQAEKSAFYPDLDVVAAMKAARKSAATAKKEAQKRKAFADARQAEKRCLAELKNGASAYVAALVTMAGGIAPEIERQKLVLKARRMLRHALRNLETLPAWMPATYQIEKSRRDEIYLLDETGAPKVREIYADAFKELREDWQKRCELARGVAEYVGGKYVAPEFDLSGYQAQMYFETDIVTATWTETVDARAEFAGLVAKVQLARGELQNYKPRKTESTARYMSHRRGYQKPMLKQDKLAEALKKAQSELAGFLCEMFSKYAAGQGWGENLGSAYFQPVNTYTCARITARNWPTVKSEIVSRFMAARGERLNRQAVLAKA